MAIPDSSKVTLRGDVQRPLTYSEMDENFDQLKEVVDQSNGHTQSISDNLAQQKLQDRSLLKRQCAEAGLTLVAGSFEEGASVTLSSQVIWQQATGKHFAWFQDAVKTVGAGSTPESTGGISGTAWVDKTGETLRFQLESSGQSIKEISKDHTKHRSSRVTYASLPRLMKSFVDYNDATDVEIKILGLGSSVGNGATLPDSVNQCPLGYFTSQLNAKMNKINNKTITKYNRSVDGSSVITGITSLIDALAEPIVPKLVVVAYGMNDGATASYNAGQAYSNVYSYTKEIIRRAKDVGSDVVILTSPHPHTDRVGFSMPDGVSQVYPTAIPFPVSDEALIPPVSQSKPVIDAAGDGFMMPVSYRHLRVNEAMRKAAADCGVPVIDAEWYWFKAVETYGQDALYDAGEQVHPNLLGHQQSYWKAIDDFINSISASSVMSHQQNDYSDRFSVGTDIPTALSHTKQTDATQAIQKVEAINGHGTLVNSNGDVKPLETIDSVWEFPRTTVKTLVYPGGTPIGKCREILGLSFNVSTPLTLHTTVVNSLTELTVKSTNTGIGSGWQDAKYIINNKDGVLTINTLYNYGDTIANLSATGADIVITPVAANTNFIYEIKDLYLS